MRRSLLLMASASKISLSIAQSTVTTASADASNTSTPSSSSSSVAATHTISVGAGGFLFSPDSITADVGDTVQFNFYPTNHSVARAEFRYPCIPYEYVETGRTGFWSRFKPVQAILSSPPSYNITVNDTEPIFFYCSAPGACLHEVMIGVINPNETFTLAAQKEFVANSTFELTPGEPFPTESPRPDPTMPGGFAPPATATPATSNSDGSDSPLSAGAIAGIAIGGAALLMLAGVMVWWCGRKGGIEKGFRKSANTMSHQHPSPALAEATKYHTMPGSSPPPPSMYPSEMGAGEWGQGARYPYPQSHVGLGFSVSGSPPQKPWEHGDLPKPQSSPTPPRPPVELPTSPGTDDTGNAPLPSDNANKQTRPFSWLPGR